MISRSKLIGRWKLCSHTFHHNGTIMPTASWVAGQLIYAEDGSMAVLISKKPQPEGMTDLILYSGHFTVEDGEILHHIEFSPNLDRIGNQERRIPTLAENQLTLQTVPSSEGFYKIVWQRVSQETIS